VLQKRARDRHRAVDQVNALIDEQIGPTDGSGDTNLLRFSTDLVLSAPRLSNGSASCGNHYVRGRRRRRQPVLQPHRGQEWPDRGGRTGDAIVSRA
jgi:hypothetical protein